VTNGIPLGRSLLLPVGTANSVQTLKVRSSAATVEGPLLRIEIMLADGRPPAAAAIAGGAPFGFWTDICAHEDAIGSHACC
jgi:hypothetical protein